MSSLNLAGTYRRTVAASVARIRENVLDWEHLPSLHGSSFASCALLDDDRDGWRIRLTGTRNAAPQVLKLHMAADTSRYCVTTESGPGASSEIRVRVVPRGAHSTDVIVEYHVPEADPQRLAAIGSGFVEIYTRLWDEDEAMMQARERALAVRPAGGAARLDLGPEAALALPHMFEWRGHRFRLLRVDGALVAHAATCPHWLAPLDDTAVDSGCITCPWHGYRFDIRTGRSADGRGLQLRRPPRISLDAGRIIACA